MTDKKREKPEFSFPDAETHKERLTEYLPKFIEKHQDDDELPRKFKKALKKLVSITTDTEAFATYIAEKKDPHRLIQACQFISRKTGKENRDQDEQKKVAIAQDLQNELINGLIRMWQANVEKCNNKSDSEEPDPQKRATKTPEGEFITKVMRELLSVNTDRSLQKAKRRDDRIKDVAVEDMRGDAYQLMIACMFGYGKINEGVITAHFKTYYGTGLKHFSEYHQKLNKSVPKGTFTFTDLIRERGSDDSLKFEDHHTDEKAESPKKRLSSQEKSSAVRSIIEGLENETSRKIVQIYMETGSNRIETIDRIADNPEITSRKGGLLSRKKATDYIATALSEFRTAAKVYGLDVDSSQKTDKNDGDSSKAGKISKGR